MSENTKVLVGCIDKINSEICTRFFFVDKKERIIKDITMELCEAINSFNEVAEEIRKTGEYSMIIPFEYQYGLAKYSFGCGLTHYLQQNVFKTIEERACNDGKLLSFPLSECYISMFTPSDVKDILECKGVFDPSIIGALENRFIGDSK